MRVVVNRTPALRLKTGIGHYIAQLVRCLDEQTTAGEIDLYPRGWVARTVERCGRVLPRDSAAAPSHPSGGRAGPALLARMRRHIARPLRLCSRALLGCHFRLTGLRQRYDLYHEPNFIPIATDLPTVATLPDLSVLLHPEWHPADRVAHFERHFRRGLDRCVHFLAISESSRQEIIRTLNIAPERITRTYMGVRPGLGIMPRDRVQGVWRQLGLPAGYLLYLGTIEPRKNLFMLLQAYCSLPRELRERWPLLLVGSWGWNTAAIADYYHAEARHRGVLHLGYLSEEHLAAVYNGARALVYPSSYEGFGLPPVEMMACGGAVLASTAPAIVETTGRRAHLIDATDQDGWRAALARVVLDEDWWRSLRRGVREQAATFSWERCAAETLAVYRSLCGGVRSGQAGEAGYQGRAAG